MRLPLLAVAAGLVAPALAKTDLSGCTSSEVIVESYYASYVYYVPGTGEICTLLDCGGGRAAPLTTVPGCPGYVGTATVTPSYLSNWGQTTSSAAATATGSASKGLAPGSSSTWSSDFSTITTAPFQTANGTATTIATTFTGSAGSVASGSGVGSSGASAAAGSSSTSPPNANAAGVATVQMLALAGGAAVAVAMAML